MLCLKSSLKVPSYETITAYVQVHLYRAVLLLKQRPMTPFFYHSCLQKDKKGKKNKILKQTKKNANIY